MHIHGNPMAAGAANLYSAAQAERAAAAQRAAEVRKKLLKSSSEIDGSSTPEESFLIGQWLDPHRSQVQTDDEYHARGCDGDSDLG